MSRSADAAAIPQRRDDDGFSLIEILVSIGIITVVLVALLPQLLVGIQSTGTARMIAQAKGVAQGQLEQMRNLPFYVSPTAGDYRDVLDFYYRNRTAPTTTPTCMSGDRYLPPLAGWKGYVADGGPRCDYEPATGALYRSVTTTAGFTVVVSTQFLDGVTPPSKVTPPAGYDSQVTSASRPPAAQIGVTVTVLYADKQTLRPVSTYTQMSEQAPDLDRIKLSATATAVEVGSVTAADGAVSLAAGLLTLSGSLTYSSTVTATLAGASAALATGEKASGATTSVAAPPSRTSDSVLAGPGGLSGCDLACWESTRLDLGPMAADDGLPNAGSATAPVQSMVTERLGDGLSFHNSVTADYRSSLDLDGPLLRLDDSSTPAATGLTADCHRGGTGTAAHVSSSGFVRSTDGGIGPSPLTAEACALTRASTISLFPTDFAPDGVLQVDLEHASSRCLVTGASHTPTVSADYRAVVRYHDPSAPGPHGYTVAAVIVPGLSVDPLASVPRSTPVGDGKVLGDYVDSWASLLQDQVSTTSLAGVTSVRIPGVLTLTSQPVRVGTEPIDPSAASSPTATASPSPTATASSSPTTTADPSVEASATSTSTVDPTSTATASTSSTASPSADLVDPTSSVSITFGAVGCAAEDAR